MDQQPPSKKWPLILLAVVAVLLILVGILWFFLGGNTDMGTVGKLFPFGASSEDAGTQNGQGNDGVVTENGGNGGGGAQNQLFFQLSTTPVVAAFGREVSQREVIRYVEKETGHIYDISPTGEGVVQITNTTVPRIAEASFAQGGDTVVLRYLDTDTTTRREVVKTLIGYITPSANTPSEPGALVTHFLPDNILEVSVSPDGKNLFFLLRGVSGVSGTLFSFNSKTSKEVFRSTFSEWLPQLLDSGEILLTSKPSGGVVGYSYKYDPATKALHHLLREKKGLTMQGNITGSLILFSENLTSGVMMGAYSPEGFPGDEGLLHKESVLPFSGLPEKCAWYKDGLRSICASFTTTPRGLIPDLWYQGVVSFNDIFWSVDVETGAIALLANPETAVNRIFDVVRPLFSSNEDFLIFMNKKDGLLWSLRIPNPNEVVEETGNNNLSPAEQKDAEGSTGNTPS